MKKFILILAIFLIFQNAIGCSNISVNSPAVKFNLSILNKEDEQTAYLTPGEYSLEKIRLLIVEGSYTGIIIEGIYIIDKEKDIKLEFTLKLPSVKDFKVFRGNKDSIKIFTPTSPFEITEKEFECFKNPEFGGIICFEFSLNKVSRTSSNSSNVNYVNFKKFILQFSKLETTNGKISAECKFKGYTIPEDKKYFLADYLIEGEFIFSDFLPGGINVD